MKILPFLFIPIFLLVGLFNDKIIHTSENTPNANTDFMLPGDDCANAIPIDITTASCNVYDNLGASTNVSGVNFNPIGITCPANENELWFTFSSPANPQDIYLTVEGLPCGLTEPKITVLVGNCAVPIFEARACSEAVSGWNYTELTIPAQTFIPNFPYYIIVSGSNEGAFELCLNGFFVIDGSSPQYPTVTGQLYWDANDNQIFDSEEISIDGSVSINTGNNSQNIYSGIPSYSGTYGVYLSPDTYVIHYDSIPNWTLNSDSSSYTVETIECTLLDGYDFGFVPTDTLTQMIGNIVSPNTICDQIIPFYLIYQNTGTTTIEGKITVQIDDWIDDIQFANNPPDSIISSNEFVWCFNNLLPFQTIIDTLYLQMPGVDDGFILGDDIYINSEVSYSNMNPADSTEQIINMDYSPSVLCAYDPNDKLVSPDREGEENPTFLGEPLNYTIRFQNTGNYFAQNVVIRDTLDDNLDASTIQILNTSHPDKLNVTIEDDKYISFIFANIMLPDSMANFEGSQGFVSYNIEMIDDLAIDTEINNTAHIYFDSNPAIITNTTRNTLVENIVRSTIDLAACDSILYGNEYYYTSGIVEDSLPAYGGYFIDIANITIHSSYIEEISVEIGQGNSHTLPDGTIVNQVGTYTTDLVTVEGCDSTIITNIGFLTSVDDIEEEEKFILSPIPFSNSLTIDVIENIRNNDPYSFVIYDILGRVILSSTLDKSKSINTNNWTKGVYQLIVFDKDTGNAIYQQKIIKSE